MSQQVIQQVPIDYSINTNVIRQDAGLPTPNSSNIALFTTDATTIEGDYGAYIDADSALAVVDGGSLTAKMISAIFSPATSLRNNNGQLFIVPIEASKTLTKIAYVATYTQTQTVSYQVKKDAEETICYIKEEGVAEAFVAAETQVYSDVQCTEELAVATGADYKYTDEPGTVQNVTTAYTSVEGEAEAFVVAGTQLYSDKELSTPTVEASGSDYKYTGATEETSSQVPTIQSAADYVSIVTAKKLTVPQWGVLIDNFDIDFDMSDFYTYIDTQKFLYCRDISNYEAEDMSQLTRTEGVYCGGTLEQRKQVIAAYVSVGTSANWDGTDTALTMNLKTLGSIQAPGQVDTTLLGILQQKGISAYAITAGESKVYSHSNAGGYWDDKIGNIGLTLELQYNMYNLAANTTTKFGYNEEGITAFRNAAAKAWQKFIDNGFLTVGMEWASENYFGDKESFLRSIRENGYYQYNKPISQSTLAERQSRRVTIQGAGQSAGAIHFVTYNAILG